MVSPTVIKNRQRKNALLLEFNILTPEEEEDYMKCIMQLTDLETRVADNLQDKIMQTVNYVEEERRTAFLDVITTALLIKLRIERLDSAVSVLLHKRIEGLITQEVNEEWQR